MKPSLTAGSTHRFTYRVPENKTVPHLFPEARDFQIMPHVFATGYMVGLMEWACMDMIRPHLEEGEGTLGTLINVNHTAATPPGLTIHVDVECTDVKLIVDPRTPDQESRGPLVFYIRTLQLHHVGEHKAIAYDARLTIPKPKGFIHAIGHFSPWAGSSLRLDPEKKLDVVLVARDPANAAVRGATIFLSGAVVSGARSGFLFQPGAPEKRVPLVPFGMGVQATLPDFDGEAVLAVER